MAELRRQGSRDRFMFGFLTGTVGLSASVAEGYVAGLVEEGYDTEEIFLTLSPEELRDEFGWKKGHVKRFEAFREQRGASAPQGGSAPVVAEGAPVGSESPVVVASTAGADSQAGVSEPQTEAQPLVCPFSAASSEGFTVMYKGHTVVGPPAVEEADSFVKYSFTAISKSTGTIEFSERYSALLGRHKQLLASEALAEYSPKLSFPGSRVLPWLPGSEARIEKRANNLRHYLQRLVTEASINTLLQLSTCWGVGYALYNAVTAEQDTQSQDVTIDATNLEAAINAKMAEVHDKKRRKADVETVADAVSQLQAFKRQYLDATGREWQTEGESSNDTADALEVSEGEARAEGSILTIQQITGICDALMSVEIEGNVLPKYRYASAGSLYPVQVYFSIRHDAIEGLNGGCYYYNPSTHSFNMLHEKMQTVPLQGDVADDTSGDNAGAFVIFLIGDLAAIEPLYGDYSFNFMMLEAGYITELLMGTATKQQIHLRECPPPEEDVDSCGVSPELRTSFSLSDTHRLLHCLVGSSA